MRLLVHIFRKDVRHFFPEILIHLALLIAFAATAPLLWTRNTFTDVNRLVPAMLMFLIPQMWLVLVARVVHDEALVGDRQFWITRPYPWPILLASKLVFLLAFVHLPVALTQMYLLHRGNLLIAPALPDLVRYQGLIAIVFMLPFLTIAVLTATFGRLIVSVLGGLVYIGALIALRGRLTQHRMSLESLEIFLLVIVVLVLTASVLVMYARRPVRPVRVVVFCLPVVVLLLHVFAPTRFVVRHTYAAARTGNAIGFDDDPKQQQPASDGEPLGFDNDDVLLQLPIHFNAAAPGNEAVVEGVQVSLQGADGYAWRSGFQGGQAWLTPQDPALVGVFVPLAVYKRLSAAPVEVALHVAVQNYRRGAVQTIAVPASEIFAVPGHGYCDATTDANLVQCRYPLRSSPPSLMQFQVQEAPCGTAGPVGTTVHMERHWIGGLYPGLDPVNVVSYLMGQPRPGGFTERHLCPGASVLFMPEQELGQEELTLTRSGVALPLYVAHKHITRGVGQLGVTVGEVTPPQPLRP